MDLTPESAAFLRAVLDTLNLKATAPDFEQVAASAVKATRELDAIITENQ